MLSIKFLEFVENTTRTRHPEGLEQQLLFHGESSRYKAYGRLMLTYWQAAVVYVCDNSLERGQHHFYLYMAESDPNSGAYSTAVAVDALPTSPLHISGVTTGTNEAEAVIYPGGSVKVSIGNLALSPV